MNTLLQIITKKNLEYLKFQGPLIFCCLLDVMSYTKSSWKSRPFEFDICLETSSVSITLEDNPNTINASLPITNLSVPEFLRIHPGYSYPDGLSYILWRRTRHQANLLLKESKYAL